VSGVFIAEKVDGVETVDVQIFLEATLNMSLRSVSFVDADFYGKMRNLQF
jgi:hypothetical protein